MQLRDSEKMMSELGRLINRISLSMIVAALVIALAVLIATTANGSPLKILIAVGFLGVVVLSIWLIVSMVRGR
jgi:magnesium-transporting ATPase (P-type)